MSIKDLGGFNQTLGNAGARDWANEVGSKKGFGSDFNIETPGVQESGDAKSFGDFLQDSIGKVNALQQDANISMEKLASGESHNLQDTLLAVEKAEIAFKTMNQVRSKVIDAYREIMKMQI